MLDAQQRTGILRQLQALNHRFIDHLLALTGDRVSCGLPAAQLHGLASLDAAAVHALCATPFTLYCLPFDDAQYWREAHLAGATQVAPMFLAHQADSAQTIAQLTLFLAWHVAHLDALSARSFFGMSFGTLQFFQGAEVATLNAVTARAARTLQARWPQHPFFWSDLVQHAASDRSRLHATQLFGAQLLAADLYGEFSPSQRQQKTVRLEYARTTSQLEGIAELNTIVPI